MCVCVYLYVSAGGVDVVGVWRRVQDSGLGVHLSLPSGEEQTAAGTRIGVRQCHCHCHCRLYQYKYKYKYQCFHQQQHQHQDKHQHSLFRHLGLYHQDYKVRVGCALSLSLTIANKICSGLMLTSSNNLASIIALLIIALAFGLISLSNF